MRPRLPQALLLVSVLATAAGAQAPERVAADEQTIATAVAFLQKHQPEADRAICDEAFLRRQAELAQTARRAVPWGGSLSDELFVGYVLPYAQANEAREDWRSDLARRFLPKVADCKNPGEAALRLNTLVFAELGVHYSTGRKRADQAPSESIAQGKASCTGLSILLADACRACCVPARVVSVKWPHKQGNHTWVEIFDGTAWRFCGADEPDPAGFDRAWFTADAAQCATADREHRIWAVSFAPTGEEFEAGWGAPAPLHGVDVTDRYAKSAATASGGAQDRVDPKAAADAALGVQFDRFFTADAAAQTTFEFDRNLDAELRTVEGDARLRRLAFESWKRAPHAELRADFAADRARAGGKESLYTKKQVGERPAGGLGLVIAMHGGGGVPKEVNDSQWRHMQIYYKDHPEVGGYWYCALRAPTDEWNGFYTDYFYPVLEQVIRQFVVCGDVDPDKVVALGYSHGGYGAFAIGPKMPHRFAAVHASASAPSDGETVPAGLHTLPFSFMVGGKDTMYGRRERCVAFEKLLVELRAAHPGRYRTTFTLVEKNGHTGLPDRDLLAQLVPLRRTVSPSTLFWEPTDGMVRDHYWLGLAEPKRGQRLEAKLAGNELAITLRDVAAATAMLDARTCDLTKPLVIANGEARRTVQPAPSLRTLCATLAERGDPQLAASWLVPLP